MEGAAFTKRKAEADQAYKKGQAALKTSLLKWSADHLGASLNFETAAKLYKELGVINMAKDSYLKYAECSEKIDMPSCAAEGYQQAALLETDFSKSEALLKQALTLYMIDGKAEQGYRAMSKFAKGQLEAYQNQDKDDENELKRILNLYKSLHQHVYDSDDIYTFNSGIVDEYLNLVMEQHLFQDALEARQQFVKYLVN